MPKFTREDLQRAAGKFSKAFRDANPDLDAKIASARAPQADSRSDLPRKATIPLKSPLAAIFEEKWQELAAPELTPEYRVCPERKWRFDYAIPYLKIAIELEGGTFSKNTHHTSPKGYINDCSKYNHAARDGWLVFRLATGMMQGGHVDLVAEACKSALHRFKRSA